MVSFVGNILIWLWDRLRVVILVFFYVVGGIFERFFFGKDRIWIYNMKLLFLKSIFFILKIFRVVVWDENLVEFYDRFKEDFLLI